MHPKPHRRSERRSRCDHAGAGNGQVCASLDNLSAHADYAEILDWLRNFERAPRMTFVTHGEPAAADALRMRIDEKLGWTCCVPEYLGVESLD